MTFAERGRCRGRDVVANVWSEDMRLVRVDQRLHEQCRGCAHRDPASLSNITQPAPRFDDECPQRAEREVVV